MAKGVGNDVHIAFARAGAEQDNWKTKPQSWLSRWLNGLLLQERSCTSWNDTIAQATAGDNTAATPFRYARRSYEGSSSKKSPSLSEPLNFDA